MRPSHEDLMTAQGALVNAMAKEGEAGNVDAAGTINDMIMSIEKLFYDPHKEDHGQQPTAN